MPDAPAPRMVDVAELEAAIVAEARRLSETLKRDVAPSLAPATVRVDLSGDLQLAARSYVFERTAFSASQPEQAIALVAALEPHGAAEHMLAALAVDAYAAASDLFALSRHVGDVLIRGEYVSQATRCAGAMAGLLDGLRRGRAAMPANAERGQGQRAHRREYMKLLMRRRRALQRAARANGGQPPLKVIARGET